MKRFTPKAIALALAFLGTLSAATVNQRRENQQDRIGAGVTSGQLTAQETARLERHEAGINHQICNDREDHHGRLTPAERAQVNREQNRVSRQIDRDKHNAFRQ